MIWFLIIFIFSLLKFLNKLAGLIYAIFYGLMGFNIGVIILIIKMAIKK